MALTSESLSAHLNGLWEESKEYEQKLKDHYQKNGALSIVHGVVDAAEPDPIRMARLCLLEIYEDIVTSDPASASSKGLNDRIWNLGFYSRIEVLRNAMRKRDLGPDNIESVRSAYLGHLREAAWFYKILIMELGLEDSASVGVARFLEPGSELTKADKEARARISVVHRCIMNLGDIARYEEMLSTDTRQLCSVAQRHYRHAMKLNPHHGKPASQLAIIAMSNQSEFEGVYYYSLANANNSPYGIAKENLNTYYKSVFPRTMLGRRPTTVKEGEEQALFSLQKHFLSMHRCLIGFQQHGLSDLLAAAEAFGETAAEALQDLALDAASVFIQQCVIIIVCSVHELNQVFNGTTQSNVRQKARHYQTVILGVLFDLTSRSLGFIIERMASFGADDTVQIDGFSRLVDEEDPVLKFLIPAALGCMWIAQNPHLIPQYLNYTKTLGDAALTQRYNKHIFDFGRSISDLTNQLLAFVDMDGCTQALPEDEELLGLAPLRAFYDHLDLTSIAKLLACPSGSGTLRSFAESVANRVSRIANVVKVLSEDDGNAIFKYAEAEGRFIVMDDSTKKRDLQKLMKVMAAERLKLECSVLEVALAKASKPVVVLDAEVFVYHLKTVQKWLMSQSCIIVLSIEAIDYLDRAKKGVTPTSARAREAIRYLEQRFKYRTSSLHLQQSHESSNPWRDVDLELPRLSKEVQSILQCCAYFQDQALSKRIESDSDHILHFALVTNNAELSDIARESQIAVRSLSEFHIYLREQSTRKT
ncbi:uncharacterized protein BJ171DRAFT_504084 [Polychytrium aggregatum]|uniref:uncharacterized protein n=1 Tax=Polychytrium aggregatum TaxID=110093 RepID=UPI0022FDEA83|nr:uncharacterized protein BJ171DRAFT_504084 [Polychytrium aggregatum]KAI9204919.1 hypothetical protein BJ171DRAFT_504084 [Polychytrium aggregatum]